MTDRISLADQIKEVKREIAMRAGAYPKFVERKALTQANADKQSAALRAALVTLEWIAKHECEIRSMFTSEPR